MTIEIGDIFSLEEKKTPELDSSIKSIIPYPEEFSIVETDKEVELVLDELLFQKPLNDIYRARKLSSWHHYQDEQTSFIVKSSSKDSMQETPDGELFTRLTYLQEAFMFKQFPKSSPKFARYLPHLYDTIGSFDRRKFPGIVVEELCGENLTDRDHNFIENLETLIEVGTVLEEIHKQGFVHRDIAEKNVQFRNKYKKGDLISGVVLIDGGFAYHKDSYLMNPFLKDPGTLGTPRYMDEAAASGDIKPESDIYALGIMMYHLLARASFPRDDASEKLSPGLLRSRRPTSTETSRQIPHLDKLLSEMFNPKMSLRPKLDYIIGVLQQIHQDFSGKTYLPEYLRQAS